MGRTVRRTVHGVKGLTRELNKLRDLPKEATDQLRDESVAIAADVATEARGRALSGGVAKVAKYVAPTIRATRDRAPVVRMGGSGKLPPRNGVFRSATGCRSSAWAARRGCHLAAAPRARASWAT
jgi:hypothetical protein